MHEPDDDPDAAPVRLLCACGRVMDDPEGATADVVEESLCDACAAAQRREEDDARRYYDEAVQAEMRADAAAGRPSNPVPDDEIPW
jgi:hypothetical protein